MSKISISTYTPFFYNNIFDKNFEAKIDQMFKNVSVKNIPQAESRLRTF